MTLTFKLHGDQDWDPAFWDRIGIGSDWDRLTADFKAVGAEVDDTENIVIECPTKNATKVLMIIITAQGGKYGPDVQEYWSAAIPEYSDD